MSVNIQDYEGETMTVYSVQSKWHNRQISARDLWKNQQIF